MKMKRKIMKGSVDKDRSVEIVKMGDLEGRVWSWKEK